MGEKMREKCLSTVEHEKTLIDNEFPKQKDLTNRIFVEILDFINQDFDGISDNKRYRCFLDKIQRRINIDWVNIDTSDKDAEHVFQEVCKYLDEKEYDFER